MKSKYIEYVIPKHDEVIGTVHFNRWKQSPNEKFGTYTTDLRYLVEDFGYNDEFRMIRDAIVLCNAHCPQNGQLSTVQTLLTEWSTVYCTHTAHIYSK